MSIRGCASVLLAAALVACSDPPPTPTPTPTPTPAPAPAPATSPATSPSPADPTIPAALATLGSATRITLRDGWNGLSPTAPMEHTFTLRREGDAFVTTGSCRAAGRERDVPAGSTAMADVAPLLARLAAVTVTAGPYEPLRTHTDDYPDRAIEIETPTGTVTFASRSQGALGEPWELRTAVASGVVSTSEPGEVMRALISSVGGDLCRDWAQGIAARQADTLGPTHAPSWP